MDVVTLLILNPKSPLLEEPGKSLSMMERCFPKPLPCGAYRFAIMGIIFLALSGFRILASAS